ncbi:MAG: DUF3343 domain-containing protein [Intestinibacter sp.]|uniref:DUF3343 domain-containing protein n=1 Tax=Intestinibacter sp. TaxID=1965304 RepID=UPI002A802A4E|nr:DUF3343 domain-containing protein [Intestinibacter sp.]MDY4575245.1 DUF3343 domain-containing protein [Intestinibacter sp.]
MKQYYVLFENHDNGMRLYNSLKSKNIKCTIAPTPRVASKSCGISLLVNKEDIEKIRECVSNESIDIIDIVEIEKNIRPNRDRYC